MATKPLKVNCGPMSIQIGERTAHEDWAPPDSSADVRDVARFESLLNRGGGGGGDAQAPPELPLRPSSVAGVQELADADDIGAEIAHLWVGTGLHGVREVRVGLREQLLPDTSVRLFESGGALRIEFTCASHRVADWLDRKLPALARELKLHLRRGLELAVFMGDGTLVGEHGDSGDAR